MKNILVLVLLLWYATSMAQSGWVKAKNDLYLQASYISFTSPNYYTLEGDRLETPNFTQHSIALYGEYGLGNRLAVEYNHILYRWNGFETTETVSGFGDAFVGLKYGILQGKFPLSITVGPEIPIGNRSLVARNTTDPNSFLNLPTGDGEWNILSTLALSHSLGKVYFSAFFTFNFRTEFEGSPFSNQIRSGLEVGFQPVRKIWLQGKARIFTTLGDPTLGADFLRGEGTAFTSFEFGGSYAVTSKYHIVANTAFYSDLLVDRKNLYSSPNYMLGVAFKLE